MIIYFSGYHMLHHIIWCSSIPLWIYNYCCWHNWYSLFYKKGLVHLENLLKREGWEIFRWMKEREKGEVSLEMEEGTAVQSRIFYSSFDDGSSNMFLVCLNILSTFETKHWNITCNLIFCYHWYNTSHSLQWNHIL